MSQPVPGLGWPSILRLGLIQAMLGAVVVLVTVTMNRVMVVELGLPALLPAALVALHYGIQVIRPVMGHGSDRGGRRTPWIVGGMALLGTGALLATQALPLLGGPGFAMGLVLAVLAYGMIGAGVGTSGTALLSLLSDRVAPGRRPAAASTVWIMMIAGIAITAGLSASALNPFSLHRLTLLVGTVCGLALLVTMLAVAGIEQRVGTLAMSSPRSDNSLRDALRAMLRDRQARLFTGFVAISMLAYSAEEILLEPFAGRVFGLTPDRTAALTGLQHGGALLGMLLVAVLGRHGPGLKRWVGGGCIGSAACLAALALAGLMHEATALRLAVSGLGLANGVFAVAAIGAMMQMAGRSGTGVRIGVWGAAQALAFAVGGLCGAGAIQAALSLLPPADAYAVVLLLEAGLFVWAARQAILVFGGAVADFAIPSRSVAR